jgi:hypothetical protein
VERSAREGRGLGPEKAAFAARVAGGRRERVGARYSVTDAAKFGGEGHRCVLGRRRHRPFFEWWDRYYRGWLRYDIEAMRRDCGA